MDRGYDREFIIVDKTKLSGEEDQFKDATVFYHHPHKTMADAEVVNKYSQLVGLATLHYHWFGTFPAYIKLLPVGCAVRQLGQKHLMMLASRTEEPQEMTVEYLSVIHDLFTFYHQSVSRILKLARRDWTQFIVHMKEIFSTIIALVCHVPFLIPTVFHSLPYLELPKKGMPLFMSASRLLRECQLNRFVIGGLIVHNKKIICSQLPASIVKKLCMVAQVEYDARHSDLVHDMTKVFKIALEGEVVLKLHNLWVLEVFLTEQEVADIKECRANLLERSTAKHTLTDATNRRLENTRSPRPYGTWRRNITPSFRTGLVVASEKVSGQESGRNSLTSPTWILRRRNIETVALPVEGYRIEAESQNRAAIEETLPEKQKNMDDAFHNDEGDGEVEAIASIEIAKQNSKSSVDSFHTPPVITSPKHPLAVPDLEDIKDITPEEPTSDAPSSVDAPLGDHISSSSTLVKSAEMPVHNTLDHLDAHSARFYSTSSSSDNTSNDDDYDNVSQLQMPAEDSVSLATAEDSQQSHYGSVDEDKGMNPVSFAEEISKLKEGDKETLVEESAIHENGWDESDELSNTLGLDTPQHEKKQELPVMAITKEILPELHTNGGIVNHDSSHLLMVDGDSPSDITSSDVTSSDVTSSKPLSELLQTPAVVLPGDDKTGQEANILVDSGNGEDTGLSPTLSSVSCSDGRSSCHSSNLYTPQTASSEVQDNEASDEHDTSHLIQLCAYVQCYQDTVTILLGDSELSEDIAGLEGLWKKVMPPLYNIQAELKNLLSVPQNETSSLEDCAVNAPFWGISYYDKCKRCKASPPVVSFQFRHAVRSCHLEYQSDSSLSQISLWKDQSRMVSQRVKQCEHYFYPNTGIYNHHSFTHPVTAHTTMETLAKAKSKQTNKIFIV